MTDKETEKKENSQQIDRSNRSIKDAH